MKALDVFSCGVCMHVFFFSSLCVCVIVRLPHFLMSSKLLNPSPTAVHFLLWSQTCAHRRTLSPRSVALPVPHNSVSLTHTHKHTHTHTHTVKSPLYTPARFEDQSSVTEMLLMISVSPPPPPPPNNIISHVTSPKNTTLNLCWWIFISLSF